MNSERFPARDGCLEAGNRCLTFTTLLNSDVYSRPTPPHDSIGAHLRHCLDFLVCFLRGLEDGIVRYDQRDRDVRLSSDPAAFQEAFARTLDRVGQLGTSQAQDTLELRVAADSSGSPSRCLSTVERELIFLSGHTLHHLAIARLLAQGQGIQVPEDLTTAFSTALHRERMTTRSESVDV